MAHRKGSRIQGYMLSTAISTVISFALGVLAGSVAHIFSQSLTRFVEVL
jgi:ABC-type dipeptide/oligopeptide/nickel transport system permease subunit